VPAWVGSLRKGVRARNERWQLPAAGEEEGGFARAQEAGQELARRTRFRWTGVTLPLRCSGQRYRPRQSPQPESRLPTAAPHSWRLPPRWKDQ